MAAVELADVTDAFVTTAAIGTLMVGFFEIVICCPSAYGTIRDCCGCDNVLLKMLIGCAVLRATDVETLIGFVDTDIELDGVAMDVVVVTFVRIGILFWVMITDDPGCAG